MNFEISDKEYRDMLDILHIADVVMSGHRKGEDPRTDSHRALTQKLFALAHGQGLDRLVNFDERTNKYVMTGEFEQSTLAHVLINEFNDHVFWDELISLLTVRDAAKIVGGIDALNAMSDSDRLQVEGSIRQRYTEEFSLNGVANLAVFEQPSSSWGTPVKTSD